MALTTSGDTLAKPTLLGTGTSNDTSLVAKHGGSVAGAPLGKDATVEGPLLLDEATSTLPAAPTRPGGGCDPVFCGTLEQYTLPRPRASVDVARYRDEQKAKKSFLGAVEKGDLELIKSLVYQHDRVLCTQALGQAVNQQNSTVINFLLANGVRCDFEESDRPRPLLPYPYHGWCNDDVTEPDNWIPPLVRAVNLGNICLVRLLVVHGADVNVGYHDLRLEQTQSLLFCGRPVQLAMALKHMDIVDFLLKSGADINLNHPVWFHACPRTKGKIMRAVHLRVRAGLRAEVCRLEMERERTGGTE